MALLSIGQVAERTGLAASAIRYYEREGLIPEAARHNSRRIYDRTILERLALISMVKSAGFTIGETRELLNGFTRKAPPGKRWRTVASKKIAELDERIAEAERMKELLSRVMRCDCPTFDVCGKSLAKRRRCP